MNAELLHLWVLGGTLLVLPIALWAVWELVMAAGQRRELAARSTLAYVEQRANTPMARLDRGLSRTEAGRRIGKRIARSGLEMRVATFVMLLAGTAMLAVVLVWQILAPVLGAAAAVGVAVAFFAYLRAQERKRQEAFISQLPELARVLSNATSAGLALPTAVGMAAEELEAPGGVELGRMAESMKLGQSLEEALRELRERMPSRELGVLVSTLLVSSRSGGSLVTALRSMSDTLENRKEIRREVKTILSESTVTAWALGLMGIGLLFLMNAVYPGILHTMTTEMPGQLILGVVAVLYGVGLALILRITRFEH